VLAIALLGITLVGGRPALAIDPERGEPGVCPTEQGVTVVVDFQDLGGETIVRCADDLDEGTGLDALKAAGFQIDGNQRFGESFICRIEDRPAADEPLAIPGDDGYREACIDTSPASAYWSYWHAGNGCEWEYSQWGVKNRDVIPGGFEGWSFSLDAPSDANPAPRVDPVRPGTEGDGCADGVAVADPADDATTTEGAGSAGTDGDPEETDLSGGEDLPDVAEVRRDESSGNPVAIGAAVVAILGLAVAAGWTIRRRRTADEP
jgi:hypothetical protein